MFTGKCCAERNDLVCGALTTQQQCVDHCGCQWLAVRCERYGTSVRRECAINCNGENKIKPVGFVVGDGTGFEGGWSFTALK